MLLPSSVLLLLAVGYTVECARNTPRTTRASRNEASLEFECPEEFGYYPHPRDCTQYYVCVFGGALLESCTGGLMYSHELQTCDWPRNVGCLSASSIAKETEEEEEEDDPLLERAGKVETIQLQRQQHQRQQQHQRSESRQHQRQPVQRQQQITVTSSSPTVSQITERQSRQRQPQQQQQQHQRTYQDEEYEPATEIESDRQQRVYRGQPSTIGQVQRDRDGLRRNIISVSHPTSSSSSSSSSSSGLAVTRQQVASSGNNVGNQGSGRGEHFENGRKINNQQNPTPDPAPRRSTIQSSSIDSTLGYQTLSYSHVRDLDEEFENDGTFVTDKDSTGDTNTAAPVTSIPQPKNDLDQARIAERSNDYTQQYSVATSTAETRSAFVPINPEDEMIVTMTTSSRSIFPQSRPRNKASFSSPQTTAGQLQRNEEFERNEIFVTPPSAFHGSTSAATSESKKGFAKPIRYRNGIQHLKDDVFVSPSSATWLQSTEEVERNEISVTPGQAGRGFMIKRLRPDHQDSSDDKDIPITPAYEREQSANSEIGQHVRGESRTLEVSVNPPRQRSRNSLIPSPFQSREIEKPEKTDRDSPEAVSAARKSMFPDPENRKYYLAAIPQRSPAANVEITEVSGAPAQRRPTGDSKARRPPVNLVDKKYYVPSVQHKRIPDEDRKVSFDDLDATKSSVDDRKMSADTVPKISVQGDPEMKQTTTTTTEDPTKNEISVTAIRRQSVLSPAAVNQNEPEGNEISISQVSTVENQARQRTGFRGQARHKTLEGNRRSSTPEREKESVVNSRGQTDSQYRSMSSESPRIAKTTASTATPISKAYYTDADQSYPYYTIYDDDVSIYKDDDYGQYTVNRSVHIPQQQHQQQYQQQHQQQQQQQQPQHRQHNVRIAEVTPNSNQYSQKPNKVSDSNKYNLSPEVTVSDYDIYDSEPLKNAYRISDSQQTLRTNGISHPVVHVTTPNAIVDTYVPLTTSTQPPPTTTARPYIATVQTRGRPQVNRGTAPPRLRPTLKPSTAIVSKAQEFVDIYRHPAVRPPPIYPTPTVDKPAAKCRKDVCLLPDCSCGGTDIPGGIPVEKTPQIVLLTFDDAVNDLNKQLYEDLFEQGRKNPNGCQIGATFYVSHEWTDYSQVQNLYAAGHELASHTVSHSFGEQFSARKWAREIAGQREILAAYGGVKLEDVRGMRAPFLSVGGNNMFKMLWDTNFTYDSSMPIYENRPPSWPYTLDYKLFHDCMIPPCPTRSYPGLWEVPMVMWQDLNGGRCSMGDACSNPPTPDGVYKMLIKNFERHYTTNRAPFGLFYHAAWFTQPHHKEGFISFLDTIVAMDDVWVVTNWQALEWIRNPTPLGLLDRFEPFGCNYVDRPKKCNNAKVCNLWHKSGVRYMKTCQPCPDIYPWTGKTGIRSSRIDNEVEN